MHDTVQITTSLKNKGFLCANALMATSQAMLDLGVTLALTINVPYPLIKYVLKKKSISTW